MLASVAEQLVECLHKRHAAMPHGRLSYGIHAKFGAHGRASARVGSRDPVVDSVLIAGAAARARVFRDAVIGHVGVALGEHEG
jgi:hypothetical protein